MGLDIEILEATQGTTNQEGTQSTQAFIVKAWTDVQNVTVRNSVAWSDVATSFGASMEIFASVADVVFRDCVAIHSNSSGESHD